MKYKTSHTLKAIVFSSSIYLASQTASTASVLATPIRFGSNGDPEQRWNTATANNTSNTYTHTVNGVKGAIDGVSFDYNDKADFTMTIASGGGFIKADGTNKLGVTDGYLDAGQSLTIKLSASVDTGYRLKTLYLDQLWLDGWGSNEAVSFSDGTATPDVVYTNDNAPSFRYDGTQSSGTVNDPTWRPVGSHTLSSLGALTDLTTSNVGGIGDNTWKLTLTSTGTADFYLNEVHFHYDVELVPEPTTTSLLGLSGLAVLLHRKRR